tara:strand:- start:130 stop:741 length:612 start_codon:yes stop_codon:yes gene_type:complete
MSIHAVCRKCKFRFTSNAISIGGSAVIRVSGNTVSCPKCGSRADIEDGEYEFKDGVLVALRSLDEPKLKTLHSILSDPQIDERPQQEVVEAIRAISPEVGAILDRVGDGKLALAALMFFIMLLLARCSNGGSLITINKTEINMLWDQSLELTHSDQSREPDVEQADSKDLSAETGSGSSSIHSEVTPKKSHSPQPSPKKPSKP